MSYLNPLRLHFAGKFQAAPSTVNNDTTHFNNATFLPEYQQRQTLTQPNGWWNPDGDAAWRLIGCKVTAAFQKDGSPVSANDPVLTCLIADSDTTVPAKIVDLDPQQQLVSQVWGLQVRICDAQGKNLLSGMFEPTAFFDIWDRSAGGGGDIGAGAAYQSVLTDLEWGEIKGYPFLMQLRDAARDNLLSIKFNVDGYNMNFKSPDFTHGRIVGTIGPADAAAPRHFILGRHFMAVAASGGNFFTPQGKINFCVATVDESAGKIYLDLGNALPTTKAGGDPVDLGSLNLVCLLPPDSSGNPVPPMVIDQIPYLNSGWYESTAGVVELPAGRTLASADLQTIAGNPLALLLGSGDSAALGVAEPGSGLYLRADQVVFRMNAGGVDRIKVFATRFGKRYSGARIINILDGNQLQGGPGQPSPATPAHAIDFPARVFADQQGVAMIEVRNLNPANPRQYIDGQVYGIRPMLEETLSYGANYPFNPWDFVSLLLWDKFTHGNPITWLGDLQPIFQQYANLYPVMQRFLNLADYESVSANRKVLLHVFGVRIKNPISMPVTRDLSDAKRAAILRWLENVGPDGKPLLGSLPLKATAKALATQPEEFDAEVSRKGGKAAASARRLGQQLVK
jgi:hypothetical protein